MKEAQWFDYRLTDRAREIAPVWISLSQWAENYMDPALKSRRQLRHAVCGEVMSTQLTCSHCGEILEGRDIEPVELPAGDDAAVQ
jgi:hypothetical protein